MAYVLIRHEVDDYDEWKTAFDDHASTREQRGSRGGRLFRRADDPNHVVILFEWDSLENARAFTDSDDLRETMAEAGVSGEPQILFMEELEEFDV